MSELIDDPNSARTGNEIFDESPTSNPDVTEPVDQTPKRRNISLFQLLVGALFVVCVVIGVVLLIFSENANKSNVKPNDITEQTNINPTLGTGFSAVIQTTTTPAIIIAPTSTPKIYHTNTPINTPTRAPMPTPTPTRTPRPPIVNISYPSEMQVINMTENQQLCVADVPNGGDTSGTMRRHNINDGGWSGYTQVFTLCFTPNEGINRIQLQYKNSYGDESTQYTRQFVFHRISPMTITYSGQVFLDTNCNGNFDSGSENYINFSTKINILQIPGAQTLATPTTGLSGNWSFSKQIMDNESITLQAVVDSSIPAPYVLYPDSDKRIFNRTFDTNNRNISILQPIVTTTIYTTICPH